MGLQGMQGQLRGSHSMVWRITLVLALLVALTLSLIGGLALRQMQHERERVDNERVDNINRDYRRDLESRLSVAATIVRLLSSSDIGPGDERLQQDVLRSDAIHSVVVMPWREPADSASAQALPQFDASDWLALSAGQALLKTNTPEPGRHTIYIVRRVRANGEPRIAFFEVSRKWLWESAHDLPAEVSLAIIDARQRRIYDTPPLSADLVGMVARAPVYDNAPGTVLSIRQWQAQGRAWRGAVSRMDYSVPQLRSVPWLVLTYSPAQGLPAAFTGMAGTLSLLLGVILLALLGAAWYLGRLWEPVLRGIDGALARLAEGEFPRVEPGIGADAPRAVAESFNAAVAALEQRVTVLRTLEEIDRLLLESEELEQALDGVLSRICAVTHCQAAAVALIDRDAAGYGRSFIALRNSAARPVSRINIDAQMLETLQESPAGLTIMRCEPERHSFLEPLRDVAEFFWVWPVLTQGRVMAIVSIGYARQPVSAPALAAYGGECAARLATALWNRVRGEELYRQAHFDSLTTLPNRVLFRDRLSQEIASSVDGARRGALLYLDLDHFKKVNDSVGHLAGDQLLTIVAQRLRSCVKEGDTVARLGGDEFAVILRHIDAPEAAHEVAMRIIELVKHPVNIAGADHFVRVSIGITLFPDDGNTIEELMRNADQAMYRAKDGGRARAVFFDRTVASAQSPVAESGLFRALRRREFALYYQPQYALHDCSLIGLEALLRWQTPRDGMRYPKDFVPAAETSGLIIDIGTWVLETACTQLAQWREQGIAPARLALNISVQQLRTAQFTRHVVRTLASTGLPAQMLELEITEPVLADEEANANLRQLAALGVRLALDDFGSGYSSLNGLRQHPVHSIKMDQSFIQEVPDSIQAATLAETLINMAHALHKTVVAEGVETLEQLDFLRSRGCDIAQGYVLSRPVSVVAVSELLRTRLVPEAVLQQTAG